MGNRDLRIQLRDKVIEQLLSMSIRPYQIVALNMEDVADDNGKMFLRIFNKENSSDEYKFVSLPLQAQEDLEIFLVDGRPLYERQSKALFPNRFGRRLTTRSIRMRYGRSLKQVKRKNIVIGTPCGNDFVEQFNQWNRTQVVYFAQRKDEIIKIGYSKCFSTRFQNLESEYGQLKLLGLVGGNGDLEAKMKRWFCHLLVEGTEWFRPDHELLAFIQRIVKEGRNGLPFRT